MCGALLSSFDITVENIFYVTYLVKVYKDRPTGSTALATSSASPTTSPSPSTTPRPPTSRRSGSSTSSSSPRASGPTRRPSRTGASPRTCVRCAFIIRPLVILNNFLRIVSEASNVWSSSFELRHHGGEHLLRDLPRQSVQRQTDGLDGLGDLERIPDDFSVSVNYAAASDQPEKRKLDLFFLTKGEWADAQAIAHGSLSPSSMETTASSVPSKTPTREPEPVDKRPSAKECVTI